MKTRLAIKVRAGARRTEFSGKLADTWKLQVAAPPVDGKANAAILRYLAKLLSIPAAHVRIVSGFTTSTKLLEIDGFDSERLERAILESYGPRPDSGSTAPRKT